MKTLYRGIFYLFSLILVLSACQASTSGEPTIQPAVPTEPPPTTTPAPPDIKEQLTMGVILFQNDNFFETVALGMEDAAKEADVKLQFRFHEDDVSLEAQWIADFVEAEVDAILISPRIVDLETSIAAIHTAYEAGIPVVCYNGCFTDEKTADHVVGHFETDQYAVGYAVGEYLTTWLEEQNITAPHIGILSCCAKRDAGFRQALSDNNVAWSEDANFEEYLAQPAEIAAETMLQNHPDINILWTQNEGATVGAVLAAQAQESDRDVFVFGVDISPQIARMLLAEDNILQAVAAQAPYEIGVLTLQAALDAINHDKKAGHVYVPAAFYTRDDVEAIQRYLEPQP